MADKAKALLFVLCLVAVGGWMLDDARAAESSADAAGAYDLEEIVVTASRRAENAFVMPYSVNVQGMSELQENHQVRTIPDAMRELSGVMVQKTGHGQGSPYIRGFTGMRTLFLVDGIRLNNSTFREGPNQYWNTVDPFSVYRLELVKGPSSVTYGSDAIGGTVNAITRAYGDLSTAPGAQTRVAVRAASAEQSVIVRPEIDYSQGSLELHAGISIKNFGNLHAGHNSGEQQKTGYEEQAAELMARFDLDHSRSLTAAIQHVDQDDAWRVHKTVFGQSWRGTTTGSDLRRSFDQQRTLAYLQYRDDEFTSWASNLTLSVSYHQQDEQRLRIRESGRFDVQGTDVGTLGAWGQFDVPSRLGLWTTGVEYYRDDVDSFRNEFDADGNLERAAIQGPVADDSSYVMLAAFLQNQVPLGDKAELIVGLRYTESSADARAVEDPLTGQRTSIEGEWEKVTGSIRYSRRLDSAGKTRVFAGVSQGFRAPNLSDLTRFDSARSNEFEIPVSGIDDEEFVTYEVGTKIIRDKWDGQLSVFYTSIDDLIIRTPTGRIIDGEVEVSKQNSGRGFVKGVEVQARYHFTDAWYMFGNATWIDGEVDAFPLGGGNAVSEPLDRLMPAMLYLGVHWQPELSPFWLETLVGAADKQSKLSARDMADTDRIPIGGTPGYATLTLRGGWRFSDRLNMSLSLENLFDENYRIHGSGLNEPGRNLIVSIFWQ